MVMYAPTMLRPALIALLVTSCATTGRPPAPALRAEVHAVVDLPFRARPPAGASPARDVTLSARFRHDSGAELAVAGFWDGEDRFVVRFCPTRAGRWTVVGVESNLPELAAQHRGEAIDAVAAGHHGFWEVDAGAPGRRWYRRSDGTHQYVVGNTHYTIVSGTYVDGQPSGRDVAADVAGNARYFKKVRFSPIGDLYPAPGDGPFLDDAGAPTVDGRFSHRPNPRWFRERVDPLVQEAFRHDLIADLIMSGVDTRAARSALRAEGNGGDPTPFLRYLAARYGSYPNVWLCLVNEYDIRNPRFTPAEIADLGRRLRALLPYPTPVSVHGKSGPWDGRLNEGAPWNDHVIVQNKIRHVAPAADFVRDSFARGGGDRPVIDDELAYQGEGDRFSEEDTVAAHLGAFLGGGYGTTGHKTAEKRGQYFPGTFDPSQHTAADNLGWLREVIDRDVTFWKMSPAPIAVRNGDGGERALVWAGEEMVLGAEGERHGLAVTLPPGRWRVTCYDAMARTQAVLAAAAEGEVTFDTPASRAVLVHFKRLR